LVEQGADVKAVNDDGYSVLMLAMQNRNLALETVELLLARGANANAVRENGATVLMEALNRFHPQEEKIVKLLVEHGADVNATNFSGKSVIEMALRAVPKLPLSVVE